MKAEFGHKRRIVEAMLAKRKIRTFWGGRCYGIGAFALFTAHAN